MPTKSQVGTCKSYTINTGPFKPENCDGSIQVLLIKKALYAKPVMAAPHNVKIDKYWGVTLSIGKFERSALKTLRFILDNLHIGRRNAIPNVD